MEFRYAVRMLAKTPGFTEMVRVVGQYDGPAIGTFSYLEYEQLRDQSHSFASVVAISTPQSILCTLPGSQPGDSQVVNTRLVSSNYFEALGSTWRSGARLA
jgi:hypothetical protein